MSENWKIQVSPKLTDGTLINLRAETPEQAEHILDWAIANATKIGEAVQAVNAVSVVAASFPGSQVVVQPNPAAGGFEQGSPARQPYPQGNGQWSQQGSQQQDGGASNYAANSGAPAPQQSAQPVPGQDGVLPQQNCMHGPMTLRRAKPDSGKKWVAYMCPTKQGTPGQCSPIDAKTGKSWN